MFFYRKWKNFLRESVDSKLVAKAIIYDGDRILFLKTGFDDSWDLPGGHLHKDEVDDPVRGLKREVKEETGLEISGPVWLFQKKHRIFYKVPLPKGQIKLSDEHTGHKFIAFKDIDKYNVASKFVAAAKAAYAEG